MKTVEEKLLFGARAMMMSYKDDDDDNDNTAET